LDHIEENLLETFILNKSKLSPDVVDYIENHLSTCQICNEIDTYLSEFYYELKTADDSKSPAVERFIKKHFPDYYITYLYPLKIDSFSTMPDDGYTTVLAAMSSKKSKQRFETITTFASEQKNMLVRILFDKTTNIFMLYVLSDELGKCQFAIITFSSIPAEFVTNEKGQVSFNLPDNEIPDNWDNLECIIRSPVAKYQLSVNIINQILASNTFVTCKTTSNEYEILLSYLDNILSIEVKPLNNFPPITRVVLEGKDLMPFLIMMQDGKGRCNIERIPEESVIRLYT
jgi:hypothetical protein